MIKEIKSIEIVSGEFSPLLPRIFVALKYKSGSDNVWNQVDENGKITALLSSVDNNFTLITTAETDFEEITEFVKFSGFSSILSDVPLKAEKSTSFSLFKYIGCDREISEAEFVELTDKSTLNEYKEFHSLIFEGGNSDFENWYCDFSKRIVKNDAKAIALKKNNLISVATAPMIYRNIAVISGVFTSENFRNNGYSQKTINELIRILKSINVTEIFLWCEESLESFYSKIGFQKTGSVYIETEL